jgi:D-alanyl-D-alanine dipeptidase
MPNYAKRLAAVQERMAGSNIDVMFLPYSANLDYVTGIHREEQNFGNTMYNGDWMTGLWITPAKSPILTLPRMQADFHGAHAGFDLRVLPDTADAKSFMRDVLAALGIGEGATVAIEDRARAETVLNLQSLFPNLIFRSASEIMRPLRVIKDEDDLAMLRKAGAITEAAYEATVARIKPGMTTLDLITETNYQLTKHGSFAPSFQTSFYNMGRNFPFKFDNKEEVMLLPLEAPVSISFDFGAVLDGYCYDFGRSVFFGEPDAEYRKVYDLVIASQAAGIAALKKGNTCEQADAAARAVIADAGYGHAFRHRLGHGIGMDVHEPPFLIKGDTTPLQPGMCFTAEPSIFMPMQFGARVEDIVVVGEDAGIPLTTQFKALKVIS